MNAKSLDETPPGTLGPFSNKSSHKKQAFIWQQENLHTIII